ncbi:sigma-70 family RNA polymerase sigma factor [Neofamilia massiliensis]|uniref:sigma-70 family RNA polymerase sigma factor n=1 Tax=Neofamilia massiliensis TaxID=1673724 RepID=UPI0006BB5ACA|nr:sigma-70 family RNA polymerase sigma factor [Neofamilia massiliensis]
MDEEEKIKIIKDYEPLRKSLCRKFYYLGAEDLNQDLIVLTLEALKTYEESEARLPYYIKKLCTWYCLDQAKAFKNHLSLEEKDEDGFELKDKVPADEDLEKTYEEIERRDFIREKLKVLEEDEAFVIKGYYFKNIPLKDLAKEMDLSPTSVSRIHKKAIKKLRKCFKKTTFF